MSALDRFPYAYSDPDAGGDKEAAQEKAERMADFMKDLRKDKELDELREAAVLCQQCGATFKAAVDACYDAACPMKQPNAQSHPQPP